MRKVFSAAALVVMGLASLLAAPTGSGCGGVCGDTPCDQALHHVRECTTGAPLCDQHDTVDSVCAGNVECRAQCTLSATCAEIASDAPAYVSCVQQCPTMPH